MKPGRCRSVGDASQQVDEPAAACLIRTHTSFRSRERSPEGMTPRDLNACQHPSVVRSMAKPTNCDDGTRSLPRSMIVVAAAAAAARNRRLLIFFPRRRNGKRHQSPRPTERRIALIHRRTVGDTVDAQPSSAQLPCDSVNGPSR